MESPDRNHSALWDMAEAIREIQGFTNSATISSSKFQKVIFGWTIDESLNLTHDNIQGLVEVLDPL